MSTKRRNSTTFNSHDGDRITEKAVDAELCRRPSFADLPGAILTLIMLTLPIKSLAICKCICKSWNTLISDPCFAKLHLKHAPGGILFRTDDPKRVSRTLHILDFEPEKFDTRGCDVEEKFCWCVDDGFLDPECDRHIKLGPKFKLPLRDAKILKKIKRYETKKVIRKTDYIACKPNDDKFDVVNSCNGLLCLCHPRDRDPLVVCNPVTGEFIRLPKTTTESGKMREPIYAGFGFHQKTNEYKVIRMYNRYIKNPQHARDWMHDRVIVEIHTLGTSRWRSVECELGTIFALTFPTCVNDALHWIMPLGLKSCILCFNFESESFQSLSHPRYVFNGENGGKSTEKISMGELKGLLCICSVSYVDEVTMWVMTEYGIKESWSRVFTIDPGHEDRWPNYGLYWSMQQFKKGEGILIYHAYDCLIYYDLKALDFKIFRVRGTRNKFEAIPHIPSLISLKDVVKGDNVEVLNVHSRCGQFKLREENEVLYLAEEILVGLYSSSSFGDSDESGEEYSPAKKYTSQDESGEE